MQVNSNATAEKNSDALEGYKLIPNNYLTIVDHYDRKFGYEVLHSYAQKKVTRQFCTDKTALQKNKKVLVKGALSHDSCVSLIRQYENNSDFLKGDKQQVIGLLEQIITPDLDNMLASYFRSEYMPTWYDLQCSVNEDEKAVDAFRWHCDGGPTQHLKLLIYLNPSDEHHANTLFTDFETTEELKRVGYIFGKLASRKKDIEPLVKSLNLPHRVEQYNYDAGDAVLFSPFDLAHRGIIPAPGKKRYMLVVCFTPSVIPWKESITRVTFPQYSASNFAQCIANYRRGYAQIEANAPIDICEETPQQSHKRVLNGQKVLDIPSNFALGSWTSIGAALESIFEESGFVDIMLGRMQHDVADPTIIPDLNALLKMLRQSFSAGMDWSKRFDVDMIQRLQKLAVYEERVRKSVDIYNPAIPKIQKAAFWPNPKHPTAPTSLHEISPCLAPTPIMDRTTPVGSAGSCFAYEIAQALQGQGFNFIVTERNDDASSGVLVDGYTAGESQAKYSANYGVLFNTQSFKQLAEKAFDVKRFRQIVNIISPGLYCDPYRENVLFKSVDAYEQDYPKHKQAVREALEQSKVFVISLGNNECWKFIGDGTALSSNPQKALYPHIEHCVLSVEENVANIQSFIDIVRAHNPELKLVIDISPIPLSVSARAEQQHVVAADCHSKAVLRVAADELVRNNAGVYYLPTYEMVTKCIEQPWQQDQKSLTPEAIARTVDLFQQMFVKQ